MRILVTGANGQLGRSLSQLAATTPHHFHYTDADTLDLTEATSVHAFFEQTAPFRACLNFAAYTAVDLAERERDKAFALNTEAVGTLARACQQHKIYFIHISTDFVFDGKQSTPYSEDAAAHPLGVYGESKLAGEALALAHCETTTIVRTSWLYSPYGKNFVKTMLDLATHTAEVRVVADQVGTPTYAHDLALVLLALLDLPAPPRGIFHFSNEGVASWYDFAHAIFAEAGANVALQPIFTQAYPAPAKRPAFSVLDKTALKNALPDFPARHWRDALKACLVAMGHKKA